MEPHENLEQNKWTKGLPRDFPGSPVAKLRAPNAGGPGSSPDRGTSFRMHASTKTRRGQEKQIDK